MVRKAAAESAENRLAGPARRKLEKLGKPAFAARASSQLAGSRGAGDSVQPLLQSCEIEMRLKEFAKFYRLNQLG